MTDPFHHHPRGSMSDQRKARIFARCGGKCSLCSRKLRAGDVWRVEHFLAFENGGTDDDENCGISCSWCWPKKDAEDHGKAAKSRHTYTRHVVPNSERKKSSLSKRFGFKFDWSTKRYVRVGKEDDGSSDR